jgi:hypothetical protein
MQAKIPWKKAAAAIKRNNLGLERRRRGVTQPFIAEPQIGASQVDPACITLRDPFERHRERARLWVFL